AGVQAFGELHFFAGLPVVRVSFTLRNARPAAHPGGFWELGDPNSLLIRSLSIALALPPQTSASECRCSPETAFPLRTVAVPFELFQASSGGENWRSTNHVNARGEVPLAFRGYAIRAPGTHAEGLRASPICEVVRDRCQLAVAFPRFWQEFPKALEADS